MKTFQYKAKEGPQAFWQSIADDLADGDVSMLPRKLGIGAGNFRRYLDGSDVTYKVLERVAETKRLAFLIGDHPGPVIQYSNDPASRIRMHAVLERHVGKELNTYEVQRIVEASGEQISTGSFFQLITGARRGGLQLLSKIANALKVRFLIADSRGVNTLIGEPWLNLALDMSASGMSRKSPDQLKKLAAGLGYEPIAFDEQSGQIGAAA